jgi:cytochrome c-type protein NapB
MKLHRVLTILALTGAPAVAFGAEQPPTDPKLSAGAAIEEPGAPEIFRYQRDQKPIPRQWPKQPPLIPHSIKGYNITKNFNQCLDCHSLERSRESGATKLSRGHYLNREGRKTLNVSTRRYFCMQCHVPQVEAQPRVANTFRPLPPESFEPLPPEER